MKRSISFIIIGISIYWIIKSFQYGLWVNNGPGGGLMPFIGGGLTLFFSLIDLYSKKKGKDVKLDANFLRLSAAVIATVASMYLIGVIIASTLFLLLWLVLVEKYAWFKAGWKTALVMGILYLIFKVWLNVPFYKGLLGLV